jgi:Peptidase_C39 like family
MLDGETGGGGKMGKHVRIICPVVLLVLLVASSAAFGQTVIEGVPNYVWYHGCGPTAVGDIFGYWDANGYSNLFVDSISVQDQISSPEHNAKYDPNPDNPSLPVPPKTSIADYFNTSVNQGYGWSWLSDAVPAVTGYAAYRGYDFAASTEWWGSFTWTDLVTEINAGHPMMFLVDSNGDASTDHFVPAIGYETLNGINYYGLYTEWTSGVAPIVWEPFQYMSSSYAWGVAAATFIDPISAPDNVTSIPEPMVTLLLLMGIFSIGLLERHCKGQCNTPLLQRW